MWYDKGAGRVCRGRYSTVRYRNILYTYTRQYMCLGIGIDLIFEFDLNTVHKRLRVGRDTHIIIYRNKKEGLMCIRIAYVSRCATYKLRCHYLQ